jgi:transcriptional regulator with XRE-family HTH domain
MAGREVSLILGSSWGPIMNELAKWLRGELERRGLTQLQAGVQAGVSQGTISDMLTKGHVPRIETLFRLADYFGMDRVQILRLAGHLRTGEELRAEQGPAGGAEDHLVQQLVAEFRRVPDAWKAEVVAQVQMFVRLAGRPPGQASRQTSEVSENLGSLGGGRGR